MNKLSPAEFTFQDPEDKVCRVGRYVAQFPSRVAIIHSETWGLTAFWGGLSNKERTRAPQSNQTQTNDATPPPIYPPITAPTMNPINGVKGNSLEKWEQIMADHTPGYSTANLPVIPRETFHPFHGKVTTGSTRNCPLLAVVAE
jgi:hypothetical protein